MVTTVTPAAPTPVTFSQKPSFSFDSFLAIRRRHLSAILSAADDCQSKQEECLEPNLTIKFIWLKFTRISFIREEMSHRWKPEHFERGSLVVIFSETEVSTEAFQLDETVFILKRKAGTSWHRPPFSYPPAKCYTHVAQSLCWSFTKREEFPVTQSSFSRISGQKRSTATFL